MNKIIACGFAGTVMLLAGTAFAQRTIPPNTIQWSGFKKMADGSWLAAPDNPAFDFGDIKNTTLRNSQITPHTMSLGGFNLYDVLEQKCDLSK